MYTLFNSAPALRQTSTGTIGLDYISRELMGVYVKRYKQYRAINPAFVKNDHILMRVLAMVDVPFSGDLTSFYVSCQAIVNRIAGQMGFVTSAHRGRYRDDSQFYGKRTPEIIIAAERDSITPAMIWYNWKNMSPVRVLSHPVSGVGLFELNGSADCSAGAYPGTPAVLELNIPLLACQYHLWRMANAYNNPEGVIVPTAHFISQVVIPNMFDSHLDVAVLNTFHELMGGEYTRMGNDMPFFVTDYTKRLEDGLGDVLNKFKGQTHQWRDILSNIPTMTGGTAYDTVQLPDIAHTNQVIWALMVTRLPLIRMLLKLDAYSGNRKNDAERNKIRRSLVEESSGKYMATVLKGALADYARAAIADDIIPLL